MGLPADPAAFVAAAERGINERDLDATLGVYSPDALFEALTDGAVEAYRGSDEIRAAWTGYLAAMDARGFRLSKKITAVEGYTLPREPGRVGPVEPVPAGTSSVSTIVNEWTGSLGGRTDAQGIERWSFDGDGRVREHRMYTFLNLKPSTSPLQRLRLTAAYPLTALAFLREQQKARRG